MCNYHIPNAISFYAIFEFDNIEMPRDVSNAGNRIVTAVRILYFRGIFIRKEWHLSPGYKS